MHGSDLSGQMCFLGGGDGTLCNECGTGGGEAVRRGWGSVQTAVLSSIPRPCMWVAQSILRCTAWLLLLFSLLCSPLPQSLGVSQDCGDSRIFSPYTNTTYHEIYLILKLPLAASGMHSLGSPQRSASLGRSWQRHNHCAFVTPKASVPSQTITAQLYQWQQGTSNRALRLQPNTSPDAFMT